MQHRDDHLVGRLPSRVIDAIQSGRKIEAIKSIREQYNLGLKEAKQVVDAYVDENGEDESEEPRTVGITIERVILMLIVIAILYGLYDYLIK